MSETNPRESDLVLGGQNPPPSDAAILGGLAGIEQRLKSKSIVERLWALNNAVQYGENAIPLALQSLTDDAEVIQRLAKRLLRDRLGKKGKQELLEREPVSYFTTFNDWRQEIYNPKVGITDPNCISYVIEINFLAGSNPGFDLSPLQSLLADPRIGELQALMCRISTDRVWVDLSDCRLPIEAIANAGLIMKNIKAIFIGEAAKYDHSIFTPQFSVVDLRHLLEGFPDLELLQVCGVRFEAFTGKVIYHKKLKSFKFQSSYLLDKDINQFNQNLTKVAELILPSLEYLDLRFGQNQSPVIRNYLKPLLFSVNAPSLKYIGMCYSEYYSSKINNPEWIDVLMKSSLLKQLHTLNLEGGYITDAIVHELINNPNISNIKLINLAGNCLSSQGIELLQQLPCKVETKNQR